MNPIIPKTATILSRAKAHAGKSHQRLQDRFPHVTKKLDLLGLKLFDLRRHSSNVLSAAAIAGGIIASSPAISMTSDKLSQQEQPAQSTEELERKLKDSLQDILPTTVSPLNPSQEVAISSQIARITGIPARAVLDGNHLNTTYGYMGAEQHLPRYPGDTIAQHDDLQVKGLTPGRGAFGYFVKDKASLTQEDVAREKYYVAVQTMYLPEWNREHKWLKDWYKFRKVLVVNPANGKSVVAVIGDAGPAAWTGKHYGGSPELMQYLELNRGKQKGGVILFFVDESEHEIALGPVKTETGKYVAKK